METLVETVETERDCKILVETVGDWWRVETE